jgi:hypothetical protein
MTLARIAFRDAENVTPELVLLADGIPRSLLSLVQALTRNRVGG